MVGNNVANINEWSLILCHQDPRIGNVLAIVIFSIFLVKNNAMYINYVMLNTAAGK